MRIGICDDSKEDLRLTYAICKETYDGINVEYEFQFFNKAEDVLSYEGELDLLILDIEMPGVNGIELKQEFQESGCKTQIIFVTNHDAYMQDSFGAYVFGFARKERIKVQLPKILIDYAQYINSWIMTEDGIDSRNIMYLKTSRVYTDLFLKNGERVLTRRHMWEYEEILEPYGFIKIHKSYMVNMAYVCKLNSLGARIGEEILPVSTRLQKGVKEKYMEYCKKKARYC